MPAPPAVDRDWWWCGACRSRGGRIACLSFRGSRTAHSNHASSLPENGQIASQDRIGELDIRRRIFRHNLRIDRVVALLGKNTVVTRLPQIFFTAARMV